MRVILVVLDNRVYSGDDDGYGEDGMYVDNLILVINKCISCCITFDLVAKFGNEMLLYKGS